MCLAVGGDGGWVELTAVGAVSTRLSTRDGSTLHVSDPVHVSVPLPPDTPLKGATSVPVWRFEASTGESCCSEGHVTVIATPP